MKWVKELEPETSCIKLQPMYLTCELNKERDVIWKRDGKILKNKAGKVAINIIGMQHSVTIQNTTHEDGGLYTCEVSGQEDVKTSTNVKVIGKQPVDTEILKCWRQHLFFVVQAYRRQLQALARRPKETIVRVWFVSVDQDQALALLTRRICSTF